MIKGIFAFLLLVILVVNAAFAQPASNTDKSFALFENRLLDAYWKQHPSGAIFAGYGKYYDELIIPDKSSIEKNVAFSRQWIDSLNSFTNQAISDNNRISINIIKNQLEGEIWYATTFKSQEWDASQYNISGECDYIINQPYAPLEERLSILSKHIQQADDYYAAALQALRKPVKEYVDMAIRQNEGGLSVFGASLSDSIQASYLPENDKAMLRQNIAKAVRAMQMYADSLKHIDSNKDYEFRDFRIGKQLYNDKFRYDLAIDITPEELYQKASADKAMYLQKMIALSNSLWTKYYGSERKPSDNISLVQKIIDAIQNQHAAPADFYNSLDNQVHRLKKFIITKHLFNFDTLNPPIKVRLMPEYERGFSAANAEFTPPYQKSGTTYYNIDDLTQYPPAKAEGTLKEYNNYSSQLLSVHEAVPGHCVQGIYNNKKSPDIVRSVFQNGAMIEGWAVYCEDMMVENGWGNDAPEMKLILYKWKLRELANVLIDYDIQCLNMPKDSIIALLTKECFQTAAQAEEKYHRATVSQVQLCSYYAGSSAIHSLRDAWQKKTGNQYSLLKFHETFLSFGSSPVKYIREQMMK